MMVSRPTFPSVPVGGFMNAAVLNHSLGFGFETETGRARHVRPVKVLPYSRLVPIRRIVPGDNRGRCS